MSEASAKTGQKSEYCRKHSDRLLQRQTRSEERQRCRLKIKVLKARISVEYLTIKPLFLTKLQLELAKIRLPQTYLIANVFTAEVLLELPLYAVTLT